MGRYVSFEIFAEAFKSQAFFLDQQNDVLKKAVEQTYVHLIGRNGLLELCPLNNTQPELHHKASSYPL